MPDYYQLPALVLTALLLPASATSILRFRDTRTLLWFLGFLFALLRMVLLYKLGSWDFCRRRHPWMAAAGQTSIQISSALFLARFAAALSRRPIQRPLRRSLTPSRWWSTPSCFTASSRGHDPTRHRCF